MKKQTMLYLAGGAAAIWYFFLRGSDTGIASASANLPPASAPPVTTPNGISGAKMPFNVPLKAGMSGLRGGNPTITVQLPGGGSCLIPWSDISPSSTFDYNGVRYWMQQHGNGSYFALRI